VTRNINVNIHKVFSKDNYLVGVSKTIKCKISLFVNFEIFFTRSNKEHGNALLMITLNNIKRYKAELYINT